MLVRAVKSFFGKYGHIRVGQVFNCEPHYADQLKANGLIVEEVQASPGPSANRNIPEAPRRATPPPKPKKPGRSAGKVGATGSTVRAPAGGNARTSSSLRADLASRKKTPKLSESGATSTEKPATP